MNFPTPEFDVLLVEDNPADAELTIEALGSSAWPIRFHHEADGVEAMAYLRNQQNTKGAKIPDLILLDVVMPELDGFNTCRRLRKNPLTANIPVVMVTSKNGESDQFWAERQGANGYVTKPFDANHLGATIQRFVG